MVPLSFLCPPSSDLSLDHIKPGYTLKSLTYSVPNSSIPLVKGKVARFILLIISDSLKGYTALIGGTHLCYDMSIIRSVKYVYR